MIKIEKYENLAFPEKVKNIYFLDFTPPMVEKLIMGFKITTLSGSEKCHSFENVDKPHKIYFKHISYEVHMNDIVFHLPLPGTINDFFCDMRRISINELYWNDYVYSSIPVKYLLSPNDIEKYYDNLLIKINKDNE